MIRKLVSVVYAVYLLVIVAALLPGGPPLAETVMICLAIHLLGVAGGLFMPGFITYPRELGAVRDAIILWDAVQLAVFIWLASHHNSPDAAHVAAGVALVGIVGCFYKAHVTQTFWRDSLKLSHK